jgi:hypothetical protein
MQDYLDANALALTPEGEFPPAIGNALNTVEQQNLATNSIVREIDQWLQAMGAVKVMKRLVREGNGFRENGRGAARRERTPESVHHREDFVVVLRRYGDSDDANSWVAAFRDEDGALLTHGTLAEARRQASNAPSGSVRVGDLLAVVALENANPLLVNDNALWLGVVTPQGVKEAPKPPPDLGGSWLSQWGKNAYRMMLASGGVDQCRAVMAAVECVKTILHAAPPMEQDPRIILGTAQRWCLGEASDEDVEQALSVVEGHDDDASTAIFSAVHTAISEDKETAEVAVQLAASLSPQRSLESIVERWIPLAVVLLSRLGYPNAIRLDRSQVTMATHENGRRSMALRTNARELKAPMAVVVRRFDPSGAVLAQDDGHAP